MRSLSAIVMVAAVAGTGFPTMLLLACVILAIECAGFAYFNIRLVKELKKPAEKAAEPVAAPKPEPKPVVVPEPKPVGPTEDEEKMVASLVRETISIEEAQEAISDSVASHFVEVKKAEEEQKYLKKCIIHIDVLSEHFEAGATVDKDVLLQNGLIKEIKNDAGLKVLGNGEITVALTVKAAKFSATAKDAIEKAGGTVVVE